MSNQRKSESSTGAVKKPALRAAFDRRLKLEFHGSKVTSDAGLQAYALDLEWLRVLLVPAFSAFGLFINRIMTLGPVGITIGLPPQTF